MKYKKGSEAYLIENGAKVTKVTIIQSSGGFCTVRLPNDSGIKVRINRLYTTIDDAENELNRLHPERNTIKNTISNSRNAQLL